MLKTFFVSDLHGRISRYEKLFAEILNQQPELVLLGGDLMHSGGRGSIHQNFAKDFLASNFLSLKEKMKEKFPEIMLILGNDDPASEEISFKEIADSGLWKYIHMQWVEFKGIDILGYSYVPPTPFLLKDWEKYDVSRFVDPGSVPPDEGFRTKKPDYDPCYDTIQKDLERLTLNRNISNSIFLFHSPPYQTHLDRAALDSKKIDHVPLDVHVGSIAIKRFIEEQQPMLTLHGHIHESSRITGYWKDQIKQTTMYSAAYHSEELSLLVFDASNPQTVERQII